MTAKQIIDSITPYLETGLEHQLLKAAINNLYENNNQGVFERKLTTILGEQVEAQRTTKHGNEINISLKIWLDILQM